MLRRDPERSGAWTTQEAQAGTGPLTRRTTQKIPASSPSATAVTGTIGSVLSFVFLDQDLVATEAAERAAEDQLASLFASLGTPVVLPPAPPPKGPHNIGGRVAALLGSCGLYGLWWLYDVMVQGNENYVHDWPREDAFLVALGA